MHNGRVLVGTLGSADDGIYNVVPLPPKPHYSDAAHCRDCQY